MEILMQTPTEPHKMWLNCNLNKIVKVGKSDFFKIFVTGPFRWPSVVEETIEVQLKLTDWNNFYEGKEIRSRYGYFKLKIKTDEQGKLKHS
jgi:hypothetical protein